MEKDKTMPILIGAVALIGGGIGIYYLLRKRVPTNKATINVSSTPSGAIYLNGANTGYVTPHTFTLDPGEYEVWIIKSGYDAWYELKTLVAGEVWNINAILNPTLSVDIGFIDAIIL